MSAGEIVNKMQIPEANVSQHFALLRKAGVVHARREGLNIYYRISNQKVIKACDLMREVLIEQHAQKGKFLKRLYYDKEENTVEGKIILVLGAGVGGIVVANDLRRRLPHEHKVVMVEKNPEHAFAPSYLWLMTGDRKAENFTRPIRTLVRSGVEVVSAEVTGIDLIFAKDAGRRYPMWRD